MPEQLHNALKRSPIAEGLKKAIGQHKQGEGGLERWSETLQGVVNPWGMPEWAALRGERLGAVRLFVAATAAEFGILAVGNPVGSNRIAVIEGVSIGSATAVSCFLEVMADTAIAATTVQTTSIATGRDRRFGFNAGGRLFARAGTDLTNTFGVQLEQQSALSTPAATMTPFLNALPLILQPGDTLAVIAQTVNIAMTACFAWRERSAFPGELA